MVLFSQRKNSEFFHYFFPNFSIYTESSYFRDNFLLFVCGLTKFHWIYIFLIRWNRHFWIWSFKAGFHLYTKDRFPWICKHFFFKGIVFQNFLTSILILERKKMYKKTFILSSPHCHKISTANLNFEMKKTEGKKNAKFK